MHSKSTFEPEAQRRLAKEVRHYNRLSQQKDTYAPGYKCSLTANGGLTGFLMFEFEKVHPTPALHNEVRYGLRQLHKNGKVHGNLQKRHVLVNVKKPYPNMVIEVRFLSFSQVEDAKAASEEKGEADLKRCVLGDDPAPNIIPPAASCKSPDSTRLTQF